MRVPILICFSLLAGIAGAEEPTAIRKFTEAHTRVVWVQDQGLANSDILAVGQKLKLMGFDSEDGKGERVVLGEMRNYAKPLLTPDGQRVVFSDQPSQKFYVVNWDGTGKKLLGDGLAVDVWRDPVDGEEWVYAAKRVGKPENVTYRNLRRVKLSAPKTSQKVWDQTQVGCDNFQLSADGTRAGGEFPWPNGGVADLKNNMWQKLDKGCWSSIAPDNSGLSWVFDGPHRNLQFHRPGGTESWKVQVNSAPEMKGAEVFHPRWSNHVRYFGMTGPYSVQGKVNVISGGGPQVEIFLGRFSPGFRFVEAWHQITRNERGDFYPDVWIEGGEKSIIDLSELENPAVTVAPVTWPVVVDGLMFAWTSSSQTNQIPDRPGQPGRACQIQLEGRMVPGRFHDLEFHGGTAAPENLDALLLAAVNSKKSMTVEMLVTPASVASSEAAFFQIGPPERPYCRLLQGGSTLSFHPLKSGVGQVLPQWKTPAPVVVTLSLTPKKSAMYADGKYAGGFSGGQNLETWTSAQIRLGSPNWRGRLEAVAIYSRGLDETEIAEQAVATRARLLGRKPVAQYRVTAKCIERSTIPPPPQILPYRRALALHAFEVQKFAEGAPLKLKVGDRILVARWVILDGQVLPESSLPKVGDSAELALELVDEHPELKSERQILDVAELDLPLYYDVSEPLKTP